MVSHFILDTFIKIFSDTVSIKIELLILLILLIT